MEILRTKRLDHTGIIMGLSKKIKNNVSINDNGDKLANIFSTTKTFKK